MGDGVPERYGIGGERHDLWVNPAVTGRLAVGRHLVTAEVRLSVWDPYVVRGDPARATPLAVMNQTASGELVIGPAARGPSQVDRPTDDQRRAMAAALADVAVVVPAADPARWAVRVKTGWLPVTLLARVSVRLADGTERPVYGPASFSNTSSPNHYAGEGGGGPLGAVGRVDVIFRPAPDLWLPGLMGEPIWGEPIELPAAVISQ